MVIEKFGKGSCKMNIKEINKVYRKLGVPDEFFNPTEMPLNAEIGHYVLLSERSTGKTTNVLLWSLCANKVDGITPVYVRHTHDSIAPKNLNKLVNVIVDYGYVEKLTDGVYNTLVYRAGEWRYATEKDGEIVDKYKWGGDELGYLPLCFSKSNSTYFGKVSPKDIYQQLAFDALQNHQLVMLRGSAGTGKSYLSFSYLFDLLEKNKIEKIIIFCNTVATKGSAKLGLIIG